MTNRVPVDERHYKILHNEYDGNGQLKGQVWKVFKTNVTDTTVFITPEVLVNCHSDIPHGNHGGSANFNPADFDNKKIVFECEDLGYVGDKVREIKGYTYKCNGSTVEFVFKGVDGKDIQYADCVWNHPFKK